MLRHRSSVVFCPTFLQTLHKAIHLLSPVFKTLPPQVIVGWIKGDLSGPITNSSLLHRFSRKVYFAAQNERPFPPKIKLFAPNPSVKNLYHFFAPRQRIKRSTEWEKMPVPRSPWQTPTCMNFKPPGGSLESGASRGDGFNNLSLEKDMPETPPDPMQGIDTKEFKEKYMNQNLKL